jgi:hypothetical protein
MGTITVDGITYYLPGSVADIQQLITQARQNKTEIRVRGAYHSVPVSISTDTTTPGATENINIMLSNLNKVVIDKNTNTVVVDAGCHLGYDPFDPTAISTLDNSLFKQLNDAGFAVPDMGGIIHQTVGGFLSTGSSGGSTEYSFNEMLVSITFIPANTDNPAPVTVTINDSDPSTFYAAGVSMGLLGIIVSATLSLVPRYSIEGKETITTIANCAVDLTGNGVTGKTSMRQFLLTTPYTRIFWYPQPTVSKATVWQAQQIPYTDQGLKPYQELPKILGSFIPAELAADLVYTGIGQWPNWLKELMGTNNSIQIGPFTLTYDEICNFVNDNFYSSILPLLLSVFVPPDKYVDGAPVPQLFKDIWYSGLPMDNNVSDKLFPCEFTELWVPFDANSSEDTVAIALQAMNKVFATMYPDNHSGPIPAGAFNTELYAAKPSKFWMSPSNGTQNVFRIDVLWFGNNAGSPADSFYPLFWEALAPYNFRCHWGKYLPAPDSGQGVAYLKQQYPMWDQFLQLRAEYDPLQVFVSDYWRSHLGIPAV